MRRDLDFGPPSLPEQFTREQAQRLIASVWGVLDSNEFRCPAARGDERIGNENVVTLPGEVWNEVGIPEGPYQGQYDERGICVQTITVEIEHEYGDFGSVLGSYPVLRGECATYHGYAEPDDPGGVIEQEIMLRWSERRRLRKRVLGMITDAVKESRRAVV